MAKEAAHTNYVFSVEPKTKGPNNNMKRDPFEDLSAEFKDAIAGSSAEQIYEKISKLAAEIQSLEDAKKLDTDLENKKAEYETCLAPYKEQTKALKLQIKFALRVLGDQGKV